MKQNENTQAQVKENNMRDNKKIRKKRLKEFKNEGFIFIISDPTYLNEYVLDGYYYLDPNKGLYCKTYIEIYGEERGTKLEETDGETIARIAVRTMPSTAAVLRSIDSDNFWERIDELKGAIEEDGNRLGNVANGWKKKEWNKTSGPTVDVSGLLPLFRTCDGKIGDYYYSSGFYYDFTSGTPYAYYSKISAVDLKDRKTRLVPTDIGTVVSEGKGIIPETCAFLENTDPEQIMKDPQKLESELRFEEFLRGKGVQTPPKKKLISLFSDHTEEENYHAHSTSFYLDPETGLIYRTSSSYDVWSPWNHFSSSGASDYSAARASSRETHPEIHAVLEKMSEINFREHLDELKAAVIKDREQYEKAPPDTIPGPRLT